ncbi:hypothetical protein BX616_010779 [Lobosporangium transversale]|uniref:Ribosome biogenesis protein SLX9 n=1 Tax=Lobosporangium transversale TaxID=64571 RepID=A0A1Y2G873_9FUNG|nr:ribosome biogenesis protein SLX9-domain-containing protein [Lobosporangium transversale]KAF9910757.1 hypothetical protein BX616_010779 [Lobosporangium transversale]ORZ02041.1 ribosome biogenesis protein SLX9-domain-containing protein [Lobosporangium transversale]|eukprot:XP_021876269.1 ribosome biogenesis protein SLX9-domain-containing protein [Lobosporangium transversale]
MPKVKANKNRVHHKAARGKEAAVAAPAAAKSVSESMQHMKEHFGLELEEDNRIDKRDKRKIRHDKWISKLEATYNPQKKKKKKSSTQNQTLSVDFGSFHEALSYINPTEKQQPTSAAAAAAATANKVKRNPTATTQASVGAGAGTGTATNHQQYTIHANSSKPLQSKKAKKKAAMQEILRFQNVLAHPAFKSNPLLTIQQHVKNTMEMAPPESTAAEITGGPELMED